MIAAFLRKLFKLRELSDKKKLRAEETQEELVKPFLDHLEDLRWVLIKTVSTLVVTMTGSLIFTGPILRFVQAPLHAANPNASGTFQNLAPADSVFVPFKLAFYGGIIFAFPLILFYIAEFIIPALTKKEKRYILPGLGVALALFLSGIAFCYYFVLPRTLAFFYEMSLSFGWKPEWSVGEYYSFVTQFMLVFGLAFELPVVVIILVKLGLLNHAFMSRTRAYALVLIFVVAAVITPTQDLLSLMCLGAPMYLLYEACIWIALFIEKKETEEIVPDPPDSDI